MSTYPVALDTLTEELSEKSKEIIIMKLLERACKLLKFETVTCVAAAFLTGCSTVSVQSDLGGPIREVLVGNWQWKGIPCDEAPSYSFSNDGAFMYVRSERGMKMGDASKSYTDVTYMILDESSHVLRTQIDGEDRRTERGDIVVWDLVMLSQNGFCWHRTDWPAGSCTKVLRRC